MNKNNRVISIIIIVTISLIIIGMLLATALLSKKENKRWEYYQDNDILNYYADETEYSYTCLNDFRNALQNYINNSKLKFLGIDKKVDLICDRTIVALQKARVPASRLETIAIVLNENRLPKLFSQINITFNTIEEFSEWADNLVLSVTDENTFSIIGGFINSFLNITTLTEDELATFIYFYLSDNSSDEYKSILNIFGEDMFVSFFSDTFFAIRMIYRTNDKKGVALSMNALRSSLYQLGRFYLDIGALGDVEKMLGFPDKFPIDNYPGLEDVITNHYSEIKGSLSKILRFFGCFLSTVNSEEISALNEYRKFNSENYREIALLAELKDTEFFTDEKEVRYNELTDKQNRYAIYSAQNICHAFLRSIESFSDKNNNDVLTDLKQIMISMRDMIYFLSDISTFDNNEEYMKRIEEDVDQLLIGIVFFEELNYTKEEIANMNDISVLTEKAKAFNKGQELVELYFSSIFNIWFTYKVNDWGLLKNE